MIKTIFIGSLVPLMLIAFGATPQTPRALAHSSTEAITPGLDQADRIYVKIKARSFLGSVRPGTRNEVIGRLLLTSYQYPDSQIVLLFHDQDKANRLTHWLGLGDSENPLSDRFSVEVSQKAEKTLWQRWKELIRPPEEQQLLSGFAIEVIGHDGERAELEQHRQWAEESVLEALEAWGAAYQVQAPSQINLNIGLGLASDLLIAWMIRNSDQPEVLLFRSLARLEIRSQQGQSFSGFEELESSRENAGQKLTSQIFDRVPEEWSKAFGEQALQVLRHNFEASACAAALTRISP